MKALICAAAVATACLAGCENMNNAGHRQGMTGNDAGGMPADNRGNGTDTMGQASGDLSRADRQFITSAASGGLYEVRSSQLALQKSHTDAVRQIAQHMIDDHNRANQELMQLAQRKGVQVSQSLNSTHQGMLDRLNPLDGAAFDTAYLQQQRTAHQETVTLFLDETRQGSSPDVKSWAQKTLPTLQHHLDMIQAQMVNPNAGRPEGNNPNGNNPADNDGGMQH